MITSTKTELAGSPTVCPDGRRCSRSRLTPWASIVAVVAATLFPVVASAGPGPAGQVGLTANDLRDLGHGEIVSRSIDTDVDQETASFHVARLDVPFAFAAAVYARPGMAMETAEALQIGFLSAVPTIADFDALTIDDYDLSELPGCRPGSCKLKLDRDWMTQLREASSVTGPGSPPRDRFAGLLRDYALAYARMGNAALTRYHDKKDELRVGEQFDGLVEQSIELCGPYPEVCGYLHDRSRVPEGLTSRLLWTKDDIGTRRAVIVLAEQILYTPPGRRELLVVTKQLYANHYLEGSLSTTIVRPGAEPGETYVSHLLRVRVDMLRGWGLFHGRIRGGIRGKVNERLEGLETRMQASWEMAVPTGGAGH